MPLRYDDIPGSWGAHSENWPQADFLEAQMKNVQIFCRDHVPYGSYVFIDKGYRPIRLDGSRQDAATSAHVRLETQELQQKVCAFIQSLTDGLGRQSDLLLASGQPDQ